MQKNSDITTRFCKGTEWYVPNSRKRDISEHRFEVYYQPQICLETGRIIGAEALVRKKDKGGKLILPDHFIPNYERERVIRHRICQYSRLFVLICRNGRSRGIKTISPLKFFTRYADRYSDLIKQICQEGGVTAEEITIEGKHQ